MNKRIQIIITTILLFMFYFLLSSIASAQNSVTTNPETINPVKAKLMAGKKVIGGTLTTTDPMICHAMAGAGFDYLWVEMQHSPYSFETVANLIWYCQGMEAIPIIRVPEVQEGAIHYPGR